MIRILVILTTIVETLFTVYTLSRWGVSNASNANLLIIWIMSIGCSMMIYSVLYAVEHRGVKDVE